VGLLAPAGPPGATDAIVSPITPVHRLRPPGSGATATRQPMPPQRQPPRCLHRSAHANKSNRPHGNAALPGADLRPCRQGELSRPAWTILACGKKLLPTRRISWPAPGRCDQRAPVNLDRAMNYNNVESADNGPQTGITVLPRNATLMPAARVRKECAPATGPRKVIRQMPDIEGRNRPRTWMVPASTRF